MLKIQYGATVPRCKINTTMLFAPLTVLFMWSCAQEKPAEVQQTLQSLPVVTVQNSTVTTFKEYPASIEGATIVEIRPQIDGRIQAILVDEGAFVRRGQLLLRIDDRPFQAKLSSAKASLHAAEGALLNTELEIEKLKPLVENKVISDFQLKTAYAASQVAEGNVEQARANVISAEINLEYTRLAAPVSGYIGRLNKKVGSLVTSSDALPLTLLSDIDQVHAYFSLGENDFINFNGSYEGATLDEKLKNLPSVALMLSDNSAFKSVGRIDMIGGQFDKNTGAVTLRATFANPARILRSGNTGKVRLGLRHEHVALIPQDATIEIQDKIFVFTLGDSNVISKTHIVVSGKSGRNYLVSKGIDAGAKIVATGVEHVKEGERIQPQPAKAVRVATIQKANIK
jgi:membrane fusion protein, multidrug efflux system